MKICLKDPQIFFQMTFEIQTGDFIFLCVSINKEASDCTPLTHKDITGNKHRFSEDGYEEMKR